MRLARLYRRNRLWRNGLLLAAAGLAGWLIWTTLRDLQRLLADPTLIRRELAHLPLLLSVPIFLTAAYQLSFHHLGVRRWLVRGLRAGLVLVSPALRLTDWLVKRACPPRWEVDGACICCGECCKLLAMSVPGYWRRFSPLIMLSIWYYEEWHGFRFEGFRPHGWLLFSCSRLGEDGRCTAYARRPVICREYPSPYSRLRPEIPEDCGFRILERDEPTETEQADGE